MVSTQILITAVVFLMFILLNIARFSLVGAAAFSAVVSLAFLTAGVKIKIERTK